MRTVPAYRIPSPRPLEPMVLEPMVLEDVEDIAALASIDDAEAPVVVERTHDERAHDELQPQWLAWAFAIGIAVARERSG